MTVSPQRYVLALSVEILDEVLQEVDTFLRFDLVHFDKILQRDTKESITNFDLYKLRT